MSTRRSHLGAGGAIAGAGILALGLVTAPPEPRVSTAETHAVHLMAVTAPLSTLSRTFLERFVDVPVSISLPAGSATPVWEPETTSVTDVSALSMPDGDDLAPPTNSSLTLGDSFPIGAALYLAGFAQYIVGLIVFAPIVVGILAAAVVVAVIQNIVRIGSTTPFTASEPVLYDAAEIPEPAEPPSEPVQAEQMSLRPSPDAALDTAQETSFDHPVADPSPAEGTPVENTDADTSEQEAQDDPADEIDTPETLSEDTTETPETGPETQGEQASEHTEATEGDTTDGDVESHSDAQSHNETDDFE